MSIEPLTDATELVAFEASQGSKRGSAEIVRRFLADPGSTFVARDGSGAIVGTGTVTVYRDAGAGAYAFVGGMMVAPAARRQGLARTILRAGVARAESLGARAIALAASEQGRPLYEQEAFATLTTSHRYTRTQPGAEPTGPRTVSVYPISSCEIMDLLKFDAPRFGAARGPLLASLLGAFPERAFVAFDRTSGAIVGFAGTQERFIGPVVADCDEAALRLILTAERAGAPACVIPSGLNAGAEKLLMHAGYAPDGTTCTVMARGQIPGRREAIYGLASWALG